MSLPSSAAVFRHLQKDLILSSLFEHYTKEIQTHKHPVFYWDLLYFRSERGLSRGSRLHDPMTSRVMIDLTGL